MRGVDSPPGFVEVVNTIAYVESDSAHQSKYPDLLRRILNFVLQKVFLLQIALKETMFIELIVESVGFFGEVVYDGLIEAVFNFLCDFFASRNDNQTKQLFSSITK